MTPEELAELARNLDAALQAGLQDESFGCLACGEAPCICLDDIEEE
jgi:hypothetical protein